jgi:tetratricopeptide (TPR) repeat protein
MVVTGEATHELAGNLFEVRDLGEQSLRGFDRPVHAWAIVGQRQSESRFEAIRGEHLTELVGREEELETLLRRWKRAKEGEGQVILISGEPGIGKSRLIHAFRAAVTDDSAYFRLLQCSPHHTNSALFPFLEPTLSAIGISPDQSKEEQLDKLEHWIRAAGQDPEEIASIYGVYLNIDTSSRYPLVEHTPQRQKTLLFEAFAERLVQLSAAHGFVFIVEDAHWIDPTSLEFLNMHIEQAQKQPKAMVIVTYRPEFDAPWVGQPNTTLLALSRLSQRQCASLVKNVSGGTRLSQEMIEQISERTDGVPLFAEELTKAVVESSEQELSTTAIDVPVTLQDSLEARLDRLGPAKEIAQIGAVIGRSFDFGLLSKVAELESGALNGALDVLSNSGLATEQGARPHATYTFKHALIQDTAYQSLLRDRRRALHGKIADALKDAHEQGIPTQPEVVGYHFTEAGNDRQAAKYFTLAGRQAYASWAVDEGLSHLTKALELLDSIPENRERLELEAEAYRVRGLTRKAVGGVASESARDDLRRSLEIGRKIGKSNDLLPVIANMANTEAAQGRFQEALENTETVFELAKANDDIPAEASANFMQGIVRFHTGDNDQAEKNFRRCLGLANTPGFEMDFKTWSFEPEIGARFRLGNTLLVEGYSDQGKLVAEEALAASRTPLAIASALMYGCFTLIWCRDVAKVQNWAEKALSISDEHGFAQHQGWSNVAAGWAYALQDKPREGMDAIHRGIELFRNSGRKTWLAWWLMVRADAELYVDRIEVAETSIEDALGLIVDIGENQFLSPANTLKGDILLKQGRTEA